MSKSQGTVFIVDDDASIRNAFSRLLRSVGLDVILCESAEVFLRHEEPTTPSCAVLDVRMPGLSGLGLQEEMARRGRSMPIVFVTGHATVKMCVQAMKAGATDFLEKPFDDQVFIDALNAAIVEDRERKLREEKLGDIKEHLDSLTPRETEVLALVATGLSNKQIAFKLGTSEKTVKVHRGRVMTKMHATSLAELLQIAQKVGMEFDGVVSG